jgi:hypothetical protein
MVNTNYETTARHYSYTVLRSQLNAIMKYFSFPSDLQPSKKAPDSRHVICLNRAVSPVQNDPQMCNVNMEASD